MKGLDPKVINKKSPCLEKGVEIHEELSEMLVASSHECFTTIAELDINHLGMVEFI